MSPSNPKVRITILILVTLVFCSFFYFFFKNSRASGSPLKDKEYMEQLSNLSRRYNVAGEPITSPTPQPEKENPKENVVESISLSVLEFLSNLLK